MKKMGGSKFDPELLEAFIEILPNIQTIANKYPDTKEGP